MESYTTIHKLASFEYEDRKSVFIGNAAPVKTESEALDFLAFIKKKYPDANHHVYAYVLRENSIMRFSDDREPQGTAGMPVLDAIRKNGCTDAVVVVIRYFGGTLLGTGGLVRAYSAAACGAIENAQIITYDIYSKMEITVTYSDYQKLMPIMSEYNFRIENTKYTDTVNLYGSIKQTDAQTFFKVITDNTSGRAVAKITEEVFDF